MLLSPYAASIYNNTFTTYYYDYQYGMLDQESPNIVVYETVERYLGNMLNFLWWTESERNDGRLWIKLRC